MSSTSRSREERKKTKAAKQYEGEVRKHTRIDQQKKFSDETGLCPVCQIRKKGHGITCGDKSCIEGWLMPSQDTFHPNAVQQRETWQHRFHAALRGLDRNETTAVATLQRLYKEMQMTAPAFDIMLVQAHRDRVKLQNIMPAEAETSRAWLQQRGHI